MEREIKVGSTRFVVDDPRGALGPAEPVVLKAEQLGLETAKTRQQEAGAFPSGGKANPNDPIDGIGARAALLEGIVQGRTKPWTLWFAWFFTAVAAYPIAAAIYMGSETMVGRIVAIGVVIGHSLFFLSAMSTMQMRRAGQKTVFDK